jgi:hypothetical protein
VERRKPQYLSPTSIKLFYKDKEEWYMNYIAPVRPPRFPQTLPMSIGSAFDAYVKNRLYENLHGPNSNPAFSFEALFESQVEKQNRDSARRDGQIAFTIYEMSGALADLTAELQLASNDPKFEIEVRGVIPNQITSIPKPVGNLTLMGKPDLYFIDRDGTTVIYDWKVNGFYSNTRVYPKRGYVECLTKDKRLGQHKDCLLSLRGGLQYNSMTSIEHVEQDWATQLATYGWVCGERIGSDFLVGIDQLAGKPTELRVARHRSLISREFQIDVYRKYCEVQIAIETGHYFTDLSKAENDATCDHLDRKAVVFGDTSDPFLKRTQL